MRIKRHILFVASGAAVASTLLFAGVTYARGPGDTVANVAAAGRAAVAIVDPAQTAMSDASAVMRRMATDADFQKSVLAFANKNDVAGLTSFIQKSAPNSTVTVTKLEDFLAILSFTVKGHKVTICASDKNECNGHTASVSID